MRRLVLPLLLPVLFLSSCNHKAAGPSAKPGSVATATASAPQVDLDALIAAQDLDGLVAALQPRFEDGTITAEHARLLAEVRLRQNEVPKAVKILKATLAAHPEETGASLLLSEVYVGLKQPKVGLQVLQDARTAGGTDEDLALTMGLVQGKLGNLKEAQQEFERARAAGADPEDVDYNLALIELELGNFGEAQEHFSSLLERDPELHHVKRELARAKFLEMKSDPDEIRDLCNTVLESEPEDWRAWELLGDVEMTSLDFMAAKTYYTNALKFGSKEIGNNPPRVEAKWTDAAEALREEFKAAGLIPDEDRSPGQGGAPPLPAGFEERQREARRKAAAEAEAAGQTDDQAN